MTDAAEWPANPLWERWEKLSTRTYKGRIEAELSLGDVVILIREEALGGDGSVLIHAAASGVPPKNWMPKGSEHQRRAGGYVFTHPRGETLEVFIEEIYSEQVLPSEMTPVLSKMGSEREFSDLIAERISDPGKEPIWGLEELELLGREVRTEVGPVDLLCKEEGTGRLVVLEAKRVRASIGDAYQLKRYLKAETRRGKKRPRGILIAPRLARGAKEFIESDPSLEFVRLSYEDLVAKHRRGRGPKRA